MKLLIGFCLVLIGCAGGSGGGSPGGSSPGGPGAGNPTSPTCKALNSVWTSTSDAEVHDLTAVTGLYTTHAYTGFNGVTCPANAQKIKMYTSGSVALGAGYEYTIEYQLTITPPAVGCDYWKDGVAHGSTIVHHDCNKLTMCQGLTFGCKDFN